MKRQLQGITIILCSILSVSYTHLDVYKRQVLLHYAGYIRYFSKVTGQVNAEVEDYVKQRLIDCQFKFRLDDPPDKP